MEYIEITTTRYNTRKPRNALDDGGWPNGPYLLRVVNLEEPRISQAGNKVRRVDFEILGTDKRLFWYMADADGARWAWQDVVSHFVNLDLLVGRTFLVMCRNEQFKETWVLRPVSFMAEVVE